MGVLCGLCILLQFPTSIVCNHEQGYIHYVTYNAHENYWFEPTSNGTKVKVEVDTKEEYVKFFDEVWPKALGKLKEISE